MERKIEKELMNSSFEVTEGTVESFDAWEQESVINLEEILCAEDKSFAISNDVVAFVMDGRFYVAWYTCALMDKLKESGFHRVDDLYVPFSYDSYPKGSLDVWNDLKNKAEIERQKEAEEDCIAWFETEYPDEFGIVDEQAV